MVKKLIVDFSRCVGCRYCELWCSFKHYGLFSPSLSRITVVKDDIVGMDHPIVCEFCEQAPCVNSCPVSALDKSSAGVVEVSDEQCISCAACVKACPNGAIKLHPTTSKPIVCDLCNGYPICVLKCPTNALKTYPLTVVKYGLADMGKLLGKQFEKSAQSHKELMKLWGVDVE